MSNINRRDFLKTTAGVAAVTAGTIVGVPTRRSMWSCS